MAGVIDMGLMSARVFAAVHSVFGLSAIVCSVFGGMIHPGVLCVFVLFHVFNLIHAFSNYWVSIKSRPLACQAAIPPETSQTWV